MVPDDGVSAWDVTHQSQLIGCQVAARNAKQEQDDSACRHRHPQPACMTHGEIPVLPSRGATGGSTSMLTSKEGDADTQHMQEGACMQHARCFYLAVADAVVEAIIVSWRTGVCIATGRCISRTFSVHGCERLSTPLQLEGTAPLETRPYLLQGLFVVFAGFQVVLGIMRQIWGQTRWIFFERLSGLAGWLHQGSDTAEMVPMSAVTASDYWWTLLTQSQRHLTQSAMSEERRIERAHLGQKAARGGAACLAGPGSGVATAIYM